MTAPTAPGCIYFEDIQGDLWNPFNVITSGDTVRAFFTLPEPPGFSLEKALLKFKFTNDCSGGPCTGGPKTVQYSVHQVADTSCACAITIGCHDFVVNSHCGICPAQCVNGGMIFIGFDSYRKNYGLPDNDNNGLPDGSGVIDMNLVRTNSLMLRDTLFTRFRGIVDTTAANPFWEEGFARSTITRGTSLTPTAYSVRIADFSTGTVYNCTLPAPTFTTSGSTRSFRYNFSVAVLGACLPPGFVYEVNDTIEVSAEYVVSNNIGSVVETQTITNEFALQTTGGSLVASCDNYSGGFVLVGYYYTSSGPDEFSAHGCSNVTVTENYYLSIGNCCSNYAGGNYFKYEFRHWGLPLEGRFIVPQGYNFVSANLRHYRTSGNQATANTLVTITPSNINGDTIFFDLDAQFVGNGGSIVLGDDGYLGVVNVTLSPSCEVLSDVMQPVRYQWDFAPIPNLTGPGSVNPFVQRVDSISYEGPSISINPSLPSAPGISSVVSWDFTLENNSNIAAAGNTWFALVSPSGQIVPISVVDLRTSATLTPTNGMYQVGNLPQDSSWAYRIVANYNNCSPDSMRIVSGWDCNAYPGSVASYACTPTETWIYVLPQPSELQANLTIEPGSHDICDSFLVEIQVVSSQIANIKDIMVNVGLPLTGGLSFAAGSAEMQYPQSAAFTPIADPVISGNLLTWDVNTINAIIAANDLPGTLRPDSNILNLRFYLNTNCDMISGDRIRLRLEGNRGCGDALTPLVLLSTPIQITGAVQPYVTQVSANSSTSSNCPLTETIQFEFVNAGTAATSSGDSIFFNLSPGYAYGGSFNGQVNAPGNTSPNIQSGPGGLRLGWEIPVGLVVGDTVRFNFNVNVGDEVPCGPDIVSVQTVTTQTLFCARTSTNCSASTQTGSTQVNLNIVRPDLSFTAFNSTIQPIFGGFDYNYSGIVQNTGTAVAPGTPIVIQFYCDSDNSGGYSALDNPLGTYNTTVGIANGASHNFAGNFFISNASCTSANIIYGLIVPNSSGGFCLCDSTFGNSNTVLPVAWLNVQGETLEASNRITWEANILPGHDYFVLQKEEENSWKTISNRIYDLKNKYAELDHSPKSREVYRVVSTDKNGQEFASQTVELIRNGLAESVSVYPNPTTSSVYLKAGNGADYRIFNALGQVMLSGKLDPNQAKEVSLEILSAGVYMVEFQLAEERALVRLVVE